MKTAYRIFFAVYLSLGFAQALELWYEWIWLDHNIANLTLFPHWMMFVLYPSLLFGIAVSFGLFWLVIILCSVTTLFYFLGAFFNSISILFTNSDFYIPSTFDIWGWHKIRRERLKV